MKTHHRKKKRSWKLRIEEFVRRRLPSMVIFGFPLPLAAPGAELALAEWRGITWGEGVAQFDKQHHKIKLSPNQNDGH